MFASYSDSMKNVVSNLLWEEAGKQVSLVEEVYW